MAEKIVKRIAHGQLAAAKATLYTCPSDTRVVVKSISIVNTDTAIRTCNIYLKMSGGTSRRISPKSLSMGINYLWTLSEMEYSLEGGDIIEGDASVADKLDYVISGKVY